jgi:hypothetical protein
MQGGEEGRTRPLHTRVLIFLSRIGYTDSGILVFETFTAIDPPAGYNYMATLHVKPVDFTPPAGFGYDTLAVNTRVGMGNFNFSNFGPKPIFFKGKSRNLSFLFFRCPLNFFSARFLLTLY